MHENTHTHISDNVSTELLLGSSVFFLSFFQFFFPLKPNTDAHRAANQHFKDNNSKSLDPIL